jgi:hypothetical protein
VAIVTYGGEVLLRDGWLKVLGPPTFDYGEPYVLFLKKINGSRSYAMLNDFRRARRNADRIEIPDRTLLPQELTTGLIGWDQLLANVTVAANGCARDAPPAALSTRHPAPDAALDTRHAPEPARAKQLAEPGTLGTLTAHRGTTPNPNR